MKGLNLGYKASGELGGDSLSQRMKACRVHLRLTQKEFAKLTGLNEGQVSRIENGQKTTRNDEPSIALVAKKVGVSQAWLYAGSNIPKKMWPEWWKVAE